MGDTTHLSYSFGGSVCTWGWLTRPSRREREWREWYFRGIFRSSRSLLDPQFVFWFAGFRYHDGGSQSRILSRHNRAMAGSMKRLRHTVTDVTPSRHRDCPTIALALVRVLVVPSPPLHPFIPPISSARSWSHIVFTPIKSRTCIHPHTLAVPPRSRSNGQTEKHAAFACGIACRLARLTLLLGQNAGAQI